MVPPNNYWLGNFKYTRLIICISSNKVITLINNRKFSERLVFFLSKARFRASEFVYSFIERYFFPRVRFVRIYQVVSCGNNVES
jgi:hypothetical protein